MDGRLTRTPVSVAIRSTATIPAIPLCRWAACVRTRSIRGTYERGSVRARANQAGVASALDDHGSRALSILWAMGAVVPHDGGPARTGGRTDSSWRGDGESFFDLPSGQHMEDLMRCVRCEGFVVRESGEGDDPHDRCVNCGWQGDIIPCPTCLAGQTHPHHWTWGHRGTYQVRGRAVA